MRQAFTGCALALVTPFTRDGALDEAVSGARLAGRSTPAFISWHDRESPTLTEDERARVVELVVGEAKGRVPVLAGRAGMTRRK